MGPFRIDAPPVNKRIDQLTPGPIHLYYQSIEQIDGGRNDKFAAMTNVGGWVMGYYDGSSQLVWQWARHYTLADNFFMGAFGGSFLNHQWLICACTPVWSDAPDRLRAQVDANGHLKRKPTSPASAMNGPAQLYDGQVTPDGYAVNTSQPPYQPSGVPPASAGQARLRGPCEGCGAAADAEDRGRHALGQGHHVGVVRRRVEPGARRRAPPASREAHDHLQPRPTTARTSSRTTSPSTTTRASRPARPIAPNT